MRIPEGYSRRVASVGKAKSRGARPAVAATSELTIQGADFVEFSARSTEVANARLLAMQAPDVREPLVQEISGQIGSGQYHVTGDDVAPVMIQDHLQFSALHGRTN